MWCESGQVTLQIWRERTLRTPPKMEYSTLPFEAKKLCILNVELLDLYQSSGAVGLAVWDVRRDQTSERERSHGTFIKK